MSKRRADALGAVLSASFLSCLLALLFVAEQAFPPAPVLDSGPGLPGGIRAPRVIAGGPEHSATAIPTLVLPAAPAAVTVTTGSSGSDEQTGTSQEAGTAQTSGSGTRGGSRGPAEDRGTPDRVVLGTGETDHVPPGHGGTPPGQAKELSGSEKTPPGHEKTPPGHQKTPPGHARGGGSGGSGDGGAAKTPPGHGGTPPGQAKVKDHGSEGRGKGHSKH
jgi:hypothetical protein